MCYSSQVADSYIFIIDNSSERLPYVHKQAAPVSQRKEMVPMKRFIIYLTIACVLLCHLSAAVSYGGEAAAVQSDSSVSLMHTSLPPRTGLVQDAAQGCWIYLENGEFVPHTGLVQRVCDDTWCFVIDGYYTDDYAEMYLTDEDAEAGLKDVFCQVYARSVVDHITDSYMSPSDKLWTCFEYVMSAYESTGNPRIPHYTEEDWAAVYGYDMFGPTGGGNCFSFAAAFAYLAKACGCEEVYACNSGFHGWAEVDGLVYDPEQYHDTDDRKIYAFGYDNPVIDNYWDAISEWKEKSWMRVPMGSSISASSASAMTSAMNILYENREGCTGTLQ